MASSGYLRYPHVHGDLVVFVAEDDVWLGPAAGGRAWRLSADGAQVADPRFSRDGTHVAWTSWRDDTPEAYLADTDGSAATRLTYWGDETTRVVGWTTAGEVLAVTAAAQAKRQFSWAYAIRADGAPPRRLPFGPVADLALEDEGTALLTGRVGRDPAHWKRYRGGTAGKLWVAPAATGGQAGTAQDPLFTRVLSDVNGQLASPMLIGGRLFFVSDHEGTGNIYSCALDGTGITRHTDHDGMYARNPATDGQRIVYHVAGDIWILDSPDAEPRRIDLSLGSPAAALSPRLTTAEDHLGSLACDRTGQASVIEVRGTVHWLTHKDGPARALHADPSARARLPRLLGETGKAVWVTDAAGPDALEIGAVTGEPSPVRIAEGLLGSVTDLAASPDGATVAVAAHDGRLLVVDAASGRVSEVTSSGDGPVTGLTWSPDSAWLAWSHPGPQPLSRIRIAPAGGNDSPAAAGGNDSSPAGEITDVTDGRFADTDPVFTLDGLYLAFVSLRSFDPVYDAQSFDLSFPFGSRPYLVPLGATTPSPFGPLPGGRPVGAEPAEAEKADSAERTMATVDGEGLADRVVAVPVAEARYSGLRAVKGGLAWLREPLAGVLGEGGAAPGDDDPPRPILERFDLRKREVTELVAELDWFEVSGDGNRLVVKDHDDLRVLPSERSGDHDPGETADVDLSRARFLADPAAQWRHAYAEAGRLMRRDFWTPDMSGVDWDGVLDAYRPLLGKIRGADDFTDLLWEVFGELGTSHAYVIKAGESFRPRAGAGPDAVGKLGADLMQVPRGNWVVDRVLPGESSDPRAASPLAAPGVAARRFDEIVAVDGQPVDRARGPWPLLVGAAGKPVELSIRAQHGETRQVVVVPLADERRLRYQDWVASRRALVRELSTGRLGYLHIPDMMGEGWAHFHRDLRTEMRRDALIMDVRGNAGGHISQLVVEKLARRLIGWDLPRWMQPVPYPQDARRGPVVTLADEFAGSDGDIVTAAIRLLSLGPVVGTRTWGGVIGIDGLPGHELVDGTHVTVPRYAFSFEQYGWGVENYGVEPDVEVLISPDDWAAGRDPQLETAVQLALEALDKQPPAVPPDPSTGPAKGRPPLPRRG
ncbi:MAG: PDZ domain-containing protein [Streptosporangiaceae bacterium]|nr:PDZ domain-containing protein [Streptosporangiaceae bacterium]